MPPERAAGYSGGMARLSPDEKFRLAVERVLADEGGYVNDPADPGGETNFGISKRSYPDLDIKRLSREDAAAIYRRDWWERWGFGRIEDGDVAAKVLNLAVNMGARQAVRLLQRALRACGRVLAEDGALGPVTVVAVNETPAHCLLAALRSEAAGRYRLLVAGNRALERFEKGWLRRAYS